MTQERLCFDKRRFERVLSVLENMASGDVTLQVPISSEKDELDALSYGINVLAGELLFRINALKETQSQLIHSGKLAALGELSAGIAHELNNPLLVIQGYAHQVLWQSEEVNEVNRAALKKSAQKIIKSVDRMAAIINHVRDFSRQDEGGFEEISVNHLMEQSLALVREWLSLKRIRVVVEMDPEHSHIRGNALKLEQVLVNLISNSRDGILANKKRTESVIVLRSFTRNSRVLVEVEDNGVGIPDGAKDKVFQPFFTTKEVGKGMGLGLSLSYGLIQEHDGEITFRSVPGEKTVFRLSFPLMPRELPGK